MNSPPSVLNNNALSCPYMCASVADAAGTLLFYTNGIEIRNSQHLLMANGFLSSNNGSSSIVTMIPGSTTRYAVITMSANFAGAQSMDYSEVDMALAAGMGSVTSKNTIIYGAGLNQYHLGAVKHCNGADIWIVTHDQFGGFRAFLLTSAGINTVSIGSGINGGNFTGNNYGYGQLKFSPLGNKIGVSSAAGGYGGFELWDFDNSTGVASNSLNLINTVVGGFGCEFSPDGTKFFGARPGGSGTGYIYQWDLCAGSGTAIAASLYTVAAGVGLNYYGMQMAKNGKVYTTHLGLSNLAEIANPNVAGAGCNFSFSGPSVAPNTSNRGLPNFVASEFLYHPLPVPFTYSIAQQSSCQTASFTAPRRPSRPPAAR